MLNIGIRKPSLAKCDSGSLACKELGKNQLLNFSQLVDISCCSHNSSSRWTLGWGNWSKYLYRSSDSDMKYFDEYFDAILCLFSDMDMTWLSSLFILFPTSQQWKMRQLSRISSENDPFYRVIIIMWDWRTKVSEDCVLISLDSKVNHRPDTSGLWSLWLLVISHCETDANYCYKPETFNYYSMKWLKVVLWNLI